MADTTTGGFWGRFGLGGLSSLFSRTDAAPTLALPEQRADAWPSSSATQGATDGGGLVNALSGLGTVNDKGAAAKPNVSRTPLDHQQLEALYLYTCRRLIDIVPDDATRKGWEVEDAEIEGHPFTEDDKRLQVRSRFWEADVLARVFGRSAIWMVVSEAGDPDLSTPLDPSKVTAVHNLVVLEKREFAPVQYDLNPESPRYRQPSLYQLAPAVAGAPSGGGLIHASRLLLFDGAYLPPFAKQRNLGAGHSVLEGWWDALRNDTSIGQAGAFAAQELSIFYIKLANVAAATGKEKTTLLSRLRAANATKSMANALLLMNGEEAGRIAMSLSGFKDLSEDAQKRLAMVTGYPLAVIYGEAPSGLNTDGESHRIIWSQLIAAHQGEKYAEPLVTLYRCLYAATYGGEPEQWALTFAALDELTEQEEADLEQTHAETDRTRIESGVITADEARSRFTDAGYQNRIVVDRAQPAPGASGTENGTDAVSGTSAERADAQANQITAAQRRQRVSIPSGAKKAAARVLAWKKQHPDEIKGMTATGWDRARQLARGGSITVQDLIEINAWHARHSKNTRLSPKHKAAPWRDPGYVGGLGWGGEAMARFAARQVAKFARTTADAVDPRTDMHPDSTLLAVELPPVAGFTAVQGRVLRILPDLAPEDWPHVTVLYLGRVPAAQLPEVLRIARETTAAFLRDYPGMELTQEPARVGHFGPSDAAEVPIILGYYAYGLDHLHDRLLRALAHLIAMPQHDRFRPHATLGYLPRPLTPAESTALLQLDLDRLSAVRRWDGTALQLRHGGTVAASFPLVSARLDGEE